MTDKPTRYFGYRFVPARQDDIHGPPPYEQVEYDDLAQALAECDSDQVYERVGLAFDPEEFEWTWTERHVDR